MSLRITRFTIAFVAIIAASTAFAFAAQKRKPAPRAKPPATTVVQATQPEPLDEAVLGQDYTLGKTSPITVTLDSAEYTTDRIRIGDDAEIPDADKKFLVLRYTLRNPRSVEQVVREDTLSFTVVDSTGANHGAARSMGEESTGEDLNVSLKPGQKVSAYSYIIVPAKGAIPRLVVKSPDDMVLFYDLRGKVKLLTGPALDPAAKDGASALSEVPAEFGKTYQVGVFDVTVLGAEYSASPPSGPEPYEGYRTLVVTATFRNAHPQAQLLRDGSFCVKCTDRSGVDIPSDSVLLDASRGEPFGCYVSYGKEPKVWVCLQMDKERSIARLALSHYMHSRVYVYDLTALK
jgi:hypothetical protein